jgi:site-specific recombinase XerD
MNDHSMHDQEIIEGEIVESETITTPAAHGLAVYVTGEHLPARAPAGGPDRDPERAATAQTGALIPLHAPTIDEVLRAFRAWMHLDVADGNASKETLRVYFMDVRQYLAWLHAAGLSLLQAGEEEVKAYRAFLLEPGAPARLEPDLPHPRPRYAISTVARKLGSVHRFYQMAYSRGVMPHNPADGVKAPRDKTNRVDKIQRKYLSWPTLKQLLAAPNALPARKQPKAVRDRTILILMAVHGLRVVEVHRLSLEDLDLEAGESGALAVFGKGDKWRTIHLTDASREEVKNWLQVRDKLRLGDEPALFVALHRVPGKRISVRGLRQMVNHYLKGIGVREQDESGQLVKGEGISCHSLRHSFATHAYNRGADMSYISKEMGHASVTTTEVYRDLVERERNNPAKVLTDLLD